MGTDAVAHVFASEHPLVHHMLAELRDRSTTPAAFRQLVRTLATLLVVEATADLPTSVGAVETPLGKAPSRRIDGTIAIVPILRAGLGMADGVLDLIPDATVWHIGLYRDEHTLRPTEYYQRVPHPGRARAALIVDPMLATGGSAAKACQIVKTSGVPIVKLISLIAAPEGLAYMASEQPDIPIHVGVVDERLTEVGFIYPGLGDAGDRQFAT